MLDEEEIKPSRSLDEYWAMAKRRRWYILLPAFACWAGAFAKAGYTQSKTTTSDFPLTMESQLANLSIRSAADNTDDPLLPLTYFLG